MNGVRRRAVVTINAGRGAPIFPPGYAVAVRDSINMKNNANISGHIGSNGTITIKNNLDSCGNVTPGPGKTAIDRQEPHSVPGLQPTPAAEPFDLQPVDISQGDVRTTTSAAHEHEGRRRLAAGHLLELQQDRLEQLDAGADDRQQRRPEP